MGRGWRTAGGPHCARGTGAPAGWAGVDRQHDDGDAELFVQADPARPEVAGALLEWGLSASGDELTIAVAHGDTTLAGAVEAAGFALDPLAGPLVGPQRGMFHPARAYAPHLPPGYRGRSVRDGELEPRVECHRELGARGDAVCARGPGEDPARCHQPFHHGLLRACTKNLALRAEP